MASLTYAVGDVHGCSGLLAELASMIERHAAGRPHVIVFLGDYVDKGPDTAGALEFLMSLQRQRGADRIICLRGNHEHELTAALTDEKRLAKWLAMGGAGVLRQYGVASPDRLPSDVLDWIAALPTHHLDEHRYFVHAGVNPERRLDDQIDSEKLTMRGAFLTQDLDFGRHITHGHTPQEDGRPDLRAHRSNLDTSAFTTGRLTAAVFPPDARNPVGILQTGTRN